MRAPVAERLHARDAARGAGELRATRALVREAMVALRGSLDDLRGPLPPDRDLPASLRGLVEGLGARAGFATICEIADDLPPLSAPVAAALGQIAREALANVERHAAAGSVAVTLARDAEGVVLRVADDGAGVGPGDLARSGHYGVRGMRERVEGVGGSFRIGPRPGGGTVVEAIVPAAPGSGRGAGIATLAGVEGGRA